MTGTLLEATPAALVIAGEHAQQQTIPRERIQRTEISLGTKTHLALGLAIGAALGAVLGLLACEVGADPEKGESNIYNAYECTSTQRVWVPVGLAAGGGALGAWVGHRSKQEVWRVVTVSPNVTLELAPEPRRVDLRVSS